MSLPQISLEDRPLPQIFHLIDEIVTDVNPKHSQGGRPFLYSDAQIIKCMIYRVYHRIYSYRELAWKLESDPLALEWLGGCSIPDYTTLARRAKKLEEERFDSIYDELVHRLNPNCRISSIDSTSIRSSRYDREAKKGKGTRLGWFYGYKLHVVSSEDQIPLSYEITTANVYDSQVPELIKRISTFPIFVLLGDAAYDSTALFYYAEEHGVKLATDVNLRKSKSIDDIRTSVRFENAQYVKRGLGKKIFPKRSTIERLFSTLKERYRLENPRLYGYKRYTSHVKWVLLTYLFDRYIDKQKGYTDLKAPWNR